MCRVVPPLGHRSGCAHRRDGVGIVTELAEDHIGVLTVGRRRGGFGLAVSLESSALLGHPHASGHRMVELADGAPGDDLIVGHHLRRAVCPSSAQISIQKADIAKKPVVAGLALM